MTTSGQKCGVAPNEKMATGTREWADSNINFVFGCRNYCRYCYARMMAARFHRRTSTDWARMEVNARIIGKGFTKRKGRVMFPSSHDLFPEHWTSIQTILTQLLTAGNQVLVTTKPRLEVVQSICKEFAPNKSQLQFRFTIGAMDNDLLRFWEPGAPLFGERLQSLQHAYSAGFKTSISIEPFLEYDPVPLIGTIATYVTESIWLGIMNYIPRHGIPADSAHWFDAVRKNYEVSHVEALYKILRKRDKIRFKDSIKKILTISN